jgi:hypothetical protein
MHCHHINLIIIALFLSLGVFSLVHFYGKGNKKALYFYLAFPLISMSMIALILVFYHVEFLLGKTPKQIFTDPIFLFFFIFTLVVIGVLSYFLYKDTHFCGVNERYSQILKRCITA